MPRNPFAGAFGRGRQDNVPYAEPAYPHREFRGDTRPDRDEKPAKSNARGSARRTSSLGVAGVLLGSLAMLFGMIPLVGLLMIVPAVFAIILGTVGFTKATVVRTTKRTAPAAAIVLGSFGIFVPLLSTTLLATTAVPFAYGVAVDQMEIQTEFDLKRGGMSDQAAERVSTLLGDTLRKYGKSENWREGIRLASEVGRLTDDFDRDLRRLDDNAAAKAQRTEQFENDLARLAGEYGIDLSTEDLEQLSTALENLHEMHREQREAELEHWRQHRDNIPHEGHHGDRYDLNGGDIERNSRGEVRISTWSHGSCHE